MEKIIKFYGYFWNALLLGTSIVALLYWFYYNQSRSQVKIQISKDSKNKYSLVKILMTWMYLPTTEINKYREKVGIFQNSKSAE